MRRGTMHLRTMLIAICFSAAAFAYLAGCGGGDSTATKGTLKLSITDKQSDEFSEVIVAIREVRVVPAGRENAADDDPALPVLARFDTPKVLDIMQLRFVQAPLGEVALPAGNYTQIRLILEPNPSGNRPPVNYLTLKTAPEAKLALHTPSGQQTGLKVLGPIEVKAGVINAAMIDFDPNTAIVTRGGSGGYNLKPAGIRMVRLSGELPQFGSIIGNAGSSFRAWSSATVAIKRRGEINDSDPIAAGRIFASYTSARWQAPFSAFVPGSTGGTSYKAFVTASGFALYSSPAVAVTEGQATDLGEVTLTLQ